VLDSVKVVEEDPRVLVMRPVILVGGGEGGGGARRDRLAGGEGRATKEKARAQVASCEGLCRDVKRVEVSVCIVCV